MDRQIEGGKQASVAAVIFSLCSLRYFTSSSIIKWKLTQLRCAADRDEQRWQENQRKRQEAEQTDAEWGGGGRGRPSKPSGWDESQESAIPRTEKYDLEPYDDDDYEPSAPSKASKADKYGSKSSAALQQRLAQLELDVDRDQGWIRGGSKTDVCSGLHPLLGCLVIGVWDHRLLQGRTPRLSQLSLIHDIHVKYSAR